MYLGKPVIGNFKEPVNPNKPKKERAADRRPGMSPEHLALIRQLPSCISGAYGCDAHHLRIKESRGVGLKSEDRWALPLTREEHIEVHKVGSRKEEQWFLDRGVSCYVLSRALWNAPRDLESYQKRLLSHRETKP